MSQKGHKIQIPPPSRGIEDKANARMRRHPFLIVWKPSQPRWHFFQMFQRTHECSFCVFDYLLTPDDREQWSKADGKEINLHLGCSSMSASLALQLCYSMLLYSTILFFTYPLKELFSLHHMIDQMVMRKWI